MFFLRRVKLSLATLFSFVSFGLAMSSANATLLFDWNVEALSRNTDAVVVATVEDTFTSLDPKRGVVYTHAKVRVMEVIAGSAKKDQLLHVVQLGGSHGEISMKLDGSPAFERNERCVLFVEKRRSGAGALISDHWMVTGMFQGKFRYEMKDARAQVSRKALVQGVRLVKPTEADLGSLSPKEGDQIRMSLDELTRRVRSVTKGVRP